MGDDLAWDTGCAGTAKESYLLHLPVTDSCIVPVAPYGRQPRDCEGLPMSPQRGVRTRES